MKVHYETNGIKVLDIYRTSFRRLKLRDMTSHRKASHFMAQHMLYVILY